MRPLVGYDVATLWCTKCLARGVWGAHLELGFLYVAFHFLLVTKTRAQSALHPRDVANFVL